MVVALSRIIPGMDSLVVDCVNHNEWGVKHISAEFVKGKLVLKAVMQEGKEVKKLRLKRKTESLPKEDEAPEKKARVIPTPAVNVEPESLEIPENLAEIVKEGGGTKAQRAHYFSEAGTYQIFVKTLTGKTITLKVHRYFFNLLLMCRLRH